MKTFIIAEAGVNHNGSLKLAKELVDIACDAGINAVKFQTFNTENLVRIDAPKAAYQKKLTLDHESQYEMLKSLELGYNDQIELYHYCKYKNILFITSFFDLASIDILTTKIDLPLIKIASGEITNFPLLLKLARTGKSIILSTGMSTLGEIEDALAILVWGYTDQPEHSMPSMEIYFSSEGQKILREKVSLLHCTSEYPAPLEEVNLRVIETLQRAFELPVGYSDHTTGINIALAAVACGASIIEKHFTLDKLMPGPDHRASLDPCELKTLVKGIREIELALGHGKKIPTQSELHNRLIVRKSLVSLEKISKGELFNDGNVGCKRPGCGVSSIKFYDYIGKHAERDYEKDEFIGI